MNTPRALCLRSLSVLLLLVSGLVCAGGQGDAPPAAGGPAAAAVQAAGAPLPLSRVVLFSSGVGYFQRDGQVEGDATVELSFKTAQINDLLKSMVVRDFDGGQVAGVNYASRDPLARTLKSFGIDLTEHPGLAQILAQIRGETVELYAPAHLVGTVVGVESGIDEEALEAAYLNLLTDQGLRSVNLARIQSLRLLNPALQAELEQALALLADSRSADKKRVSLRFAGQGSRRVQVGYLLEAPMWKASYRLVLGEKDRHYLQGWAIVENTTEEDWGGVRLSLGSGRPISFTMDLYRPLYVPRPRVEMELYASVVPQTYEGDLAAPEAAAEMAEELAAPMAKAEMMREAAPSASRMRSAPAGAARAEDALNLAQGVAAAARGAEAGSFFQYVIEQPVSIPRQQSAMIPIVGQEVEGRRVSIYNERVHAKHPLHGLALKNSTGLALMGGPLTVFEAGGYAGDAQIDTLAPAAERLLSFAMDLDTEVAASGKSVPATLVSVRILRGSLLSTLKARRERLYTVKNSGTRARDLLIEHPLDPSGSWELVAPAKPEEKTRSAYRFLLPVGAGASKELVVAEERQYGQTVALTNLNADTIAYYVSARVVSDKAKQALQNIGERKAELAKTTASRQEEERKAQRIRDEQNRIRQNMDRLSSGSDLYKRYVSQLEAQEKELEKLFARTDALLAREREQKESLAAYMAGLVIE